MHTKFKEHFAYEVLFFFAIFKKYIKKVTSMSKALVVFLLAVPGMCLQADTTQENVKVQQPYADQSFFTAHEKSVSAGRHLHFLLDVESFRLENKIESLSPKI